LIGSGKDALALAFDFYNYFERFLCGAKLIDHTYFCHL
jgi:hypothetical protein